MVLVRAMMLANSPAPSQAMSGVTNNLYKLMFPEAADQMRKWAEKEKGILERFTGKRFAFKNRGGRISVDVEEDPLAER